MVECQYQRVSLLNANCLIPSGLHTLVYNNDNGQARGCIFLPASKEEKLILYRSSHWLIIYAIIIPSSINKGDQNDH